MKENKINTILLNDAAKMLKGKIGKTYTQEDFDSVLELFEQVNKNDQDATERHLEMDKEIERLEKRLENAVFTDTDYTPTPKRTIEL